jgi:hypothetical protein
MLRKLTLVMVTSVLLTFSVAPLALAARPPSPSISNMSLVKVTLPASWTSSRCGVRVSATFADVGGGGLWVRFGIHDAVYGSTLTQSQRLVPGQTSASFTLGSGSPGGDTFDRAEATLYNGGRMIATGSVLGIVICPGA